MDETGSRIPAADRTLSLLKAGLLVLWYVGLLFLIFLLHDFPGREFRYWRM